MDGARRATVLATVSVLAPLVFWAAVLIGATMRGGAYDHLTQAISKLGVGQDAAIMNAGFIAYGVLTVWFALGLRQGAAGSARRGLFLLALAGGATAALGVEWLAWDLAADPPVAAPAEEPRLSLDPLFDLVHDALAGLAYAFGATGAIAVGIGLRGDPRWTRLMAYFVGTGVIVIALALFIEAATPALDGLIQRALVVLLQLWPAGYAIRSATMAPAAEAFAPPSRA